MFRKGFHLNHKSALWKVLNGAAVDEKGNMGIVRATVECPQTVIVAFDASKDIRAHAVEWALKNAIQPGDSIILLATILPSSLRSFCKTHPGWGKLFGWLIKERGSNGMRTEKEITNYCSQLLHHLCTTTKITKVSSEVKILTVTAKGAVKREAEKHCASWVILDRCLTNEGEFCAKSLKCNVVVVDHLVSKFLRLNLKPSQGVHALPFEDDMDSSSYILPGLIPAHTGNLTTTKDLLIGKTVNESPKSGKLSNTPSLDTLTTQASGNSCSASSSDESMVYLQHKPNEFSDKDNPTKHWNKSPGWNFAEEENWKLESSIGSVNEMNKVIEKVEMKMRRRFQNMASVELETSINTHLKVPPESSSLKRAMSLCSVCQHRAPAFGQPPMKFSYKDLEYATSGFSQTNFLAEGGYGPVYKGKLPDGQVVAVKQYKLASRQQGIPPEFHAEVEILSCAQHKNVVRLIGYCREGGKWLLVYEFACNGTLYNHLYGEGEMPWLDWESRHKVALGVARGLRYLHEECRGGCIIHRDLRPSNILLTHDFNAMVGDFGLARWQPDGQSAKETHILGTLGYLAPEYTQTGQITEKADVFSFGVILLEIMSGKKAIDMCRNRGQQRLSEWARPMLENRKTRELIDPHLENRFSERELQCMMYAASMCIDEDPESRPRISQVLRILEGDDSYEKVCSWISPSKDKSLLETDLTSQKSRDRESWTVGNSISSNKKSCRRWRNGQNVALDRPEIRPADDSLRRRQCDFEGIPDNSIRRFPSSRFKTRSEESTPSFGCNTGRHSGPIQRHQFGKLEDNTGSYSILSPWAKRMERDTKNIILTSHDSSPSLSRDTFEMPSSECGSSSDSRNSLGTGSVFPSDGWMDSNNGLYQSNGNDSCDMFPPSPANSERRYDHI